jgi:hypothetical protein
MNCAQHTDRPSAAYCRTCGKALCEGCQREIRNVIYCEDCLASRMQAGMSSPAASAGPHPGGGPHPVMAGVLAGLLPFGVGPVYNGLYSRGLVYLVVFIGLTWGCNQGDSAGAVFGIAMAAFYFWQIIDTVRSARYLQMGLPAPDPFGVDRLFGGIASPPTATGSAASVPGTANTTTPPVAAPPVTPSTVVPPPGPDPAPGSEYRGSNKSNIPLYALLLIVLGVLFLLSNLGLSSMHWLHLLWPLVLIVIGGWLLQTRWAEIIAEVPGSRQRVMGPAVLLALGIGFLIDKVVGLSIWLPLLLIVIGLVLVWQRTPPPYRPSGPPPGVAPPPEQKTEQNPER